MNVESLSVATERYTQGSPNKISTDKEMTRNSKMAKILTFTILLTSSLVGQQQEGVWCAIMRDDGLLVPLAYFNGSRWTRQELPRFNTPIAMEKDWFFWPVAGSSRIIQIGTPVLIERFAQEPGVAYVTDYRAQTTITNIFPYPKAGVALQGKASYQRMIPADTTQQQTEQLLSTLVQAFRDRETLAFADTHFTTRFFGMPPSTQRRQKAILEIQKLYRSENSSDDKNIYYFELTRLYPYDNCFSVSMFSGWASGSPKQLTYFQEELSLGDCDGKGLGSTLEPFGLLTVQGNKYFVVDIAPYEGEWATILEWQDNQLIDILPAQ